MSTRGFAARIAVSAAIVGATVAGCSSGEPTTPNSSAPATTSAAASSTTPAPQLAAAYHSPDGYAINPPAGWVQRNTDGQNGLSIVFTAPTADRSGQKPFADNINVVVLPSSDTLDANIAQSRQQAPSILKNYKLVTDQATTVNGKPAHLLGGNYDQEGVGPVSNIQLIMINGGKSYSVTFTSPSASFDSFHDVVQASLASFIVS